MDIIKRNYLSLLRTGALNEFDTIEPMSAFKWKKLYSLAISQGVLSFIIKGMLAHKEDDNLNISNSLKEEFEQLKERNISSLPSFEAKLFNKILNDRFLKILYHEKRASVPSTETLTLLNYIVANIHYLLSKGISIRLLLEMARWIQFNNHKINFEKLNKWLSKLHLTQISSLIGSVLIVLFKLEPCNVLFVQKVYPSSTKLAFKALQNSSLDTELKQRPSISMGGVFYSHSGSFKRNIKLYSQYFTYAPIETTSSFIMNCWKSVAVEEDE